MLFEKLQTLDTLVKGCPYYLLYFFRASALRRNNSLILQTGVKSYKKQFL